MSLFDEVHLTVGFPEQFVRIAGLIGPGDADADVEPLAESVGWPTHDRRPDPTCDVVDQVRRGDSVTEHDELVAAHTADDVAGPDLGVDAVRDVDQGAVAGVVAVLIVDVLEAVEVAVQQRKPAGVVRLKPAERLFDAREQQVSVGDAGERVV